MSEPQGYDSAIERRLLSGETVLSPTHGSSMHPLIREGVSHVVIAPVGERGVSIGDVVLVRTNNGYFLLHRLVMRVGSRIYTRGDNRTCGEWGRTSDVVGVLSKIIPDNPDFSISRGTLLRLQAQALVATLKLVIRKTIKRQWTR